MMEIIKVTEIEAPKEKRLTGGAVSKIREVHHFVARMYAKGYKAAQIASVINRDPVTVRSWLASEAMAELVAQCCEEEFDFAETELERRFKLKQRVAALSDEEMLDRLEDPEQRKNVKFRDLISASADASDRTGVARMEARVNINLGIGDRLNRAREQREKLIEARVAGNVVEFIRRD